MAKKMQVIPAPKKALAGAIVWPAELLREMVEPDPWIPSEVDGSLSCFYCREWDDNRTRHADDCVWVRAKAYVDALDAKSPTDPTFYEPDK